MNKLYELLIANGLESGPNKLTNDRCESILYLFELLCNLLKPFTVIMNIYTLNADNKRSFRFVLINKDNITKDDYQSLIARIKENYSIDSDWTSVNKSDITLFIKLNKSLKYHDLMFSKNFEISYDLIVIDNIRDYLVLNYKDSDYIYSDTLDYDSAIYKDNGYSFIKHYIMRGPVYFKDGNFDTHIRRFVFFHHTWNNILKFKNILLAPYPYDSGISTYIRIYNLGISKIIRIDRILNANIDRNLVLYFIKFMLGRLKLPSSQSTIKYRQTLLHACILESIPSTNLR